ncbi:YceI family protein [Alkalimonas collagenimarina]|uniref:YceI family protein n=1 Tax=Alkalimonas collagenimarina TaxID=400390 RepID=A0ABT9H0F5_9GAMM|nr:YceI family protein [Alkalimonas collagenimarina]MDP4536793.1 YceI family protein [Alkalimonas collagenimarina]
MKTFVYASVAVVMMTASMLSASLSADDWQLDSEQSRLDFVSLKNDTVAEVNQFTTLKGSWASDGALSIEIPVSGLATHIFMRDDRIWQYLLKADDYPLITATGQVDPTIVADLAVNNSKSMRVPLQLTIVEQTVTVSAEVLVTRLADDSLLVNTQAPVMLNAEQFGLVDGLNRLRDLAALQNINPMVPVTFSVRFSQ